MNRKTVHLKTIHLPTMFSSSEYDFLEPDETSPCIELSLRRIGPTPSNVRDGIDRMLHQIV